MMELGFLDMSKLYLNLQYSHYYVRKRSAGNMCFRENQVLGESKLTISEGIISEHYLNDNRYHLPPSFLSLLQVYHLCVLYRTQYLFSHYLSPKTNTNKTVWMNTSVCMCMINFPKAIKQGGMTLLYIIPTSCAMCSRLWCAQNVGEGHRTVSFTSCLVVFWNSISIPVRFYTEFQNLFSRKWPSCYKHTNLYLNRVYQVITYKWLIVLVHGPLLTPFGRSASLPVGNCPLSACSMKPLTTFL